jgi:hypothetical protein
MDRPPIDEQGAGKPAEPEEERSAGPVVVISDEWCVQVGITDGARQRRGEGGGGARVKGNKWPRRLQRGGVGAEAGGWV